jgi:hypothetical protein
MTSVKGSVGSRLLQAKKTGKYLLSCGVYYENNVNYDKMKHCIALNLDKMITSEELTKDRNSPEFVRGYFLDNQKDVPMALVQNKDVKNDEACKELYKLMYGDNVTVRPISVYEMISTPESSA